MRDHPPAEDELEAALPGAVARAREQVTPLDETVRARRQQAPPAHREEPSLRGFLDELSPAQRDELHDLLVNDYASDEATAWSFELDEQADADLDAEP